MLKPSERAWLWDQRFYAYGALSVLVPTAIALALLAGFSVN